jgi:hypothetical protein
MGAVRLFLSQDEKSRTAFLELTKYVTGAVIGSLFGKSTKGGAEESRRSPSPEQRKKIGSSRPDGS